MVQVDITYEQQMWRTAVDGLRHSQARSLTVALAQARQVATALGAACYLHDVDGRVVEALDVDRRSSRTSPVPFWG